MGLFAKKILIVFALLFATILSGNSLKKVVLQLDWKYQFEHAGYIMAKERGYYKELGLDVEILEAKDDTSIDGDLVSKRADYAVSSSYLFASSDEINPLVLLATYIQRSPLIFVTKPEIKTPHQLLGKNINISPIEALGSSISVMLLHFHIDRTNSNIGYTYRGLEGFLDGTLDAFGAFRSNEIYELNRRGVKYNIIDPYEYGFIANSGNLITTKSEISQNPQRAKALVDATNRGWRYAIDNIDETIDVIFSKYSSHKSKDALRFEAAEIKKSMLLEAQPVGSICDELNRRLHKQMSYVLGDGYKSEKILTISDFIDMRVDFNLSQEQRKYLDKKGAIKLCVDPLWYPIEAIENGKYIGIGSSIIEDFSQKLGYPIEPMMVKTWQESVDAAKNRKCDLMLLANSSNQRQEYLDFTTPLISVPIAIATNAQEPFRYGLFFLNGKKITATKGTYFAEYVKANLSNIEIIEVDNISDGLAMVESGEVYGHADNMLVLASALQNQYKNLTITMRLDVINDLAVGTRSDEPILNYIFQQLVDSLSDERKQEFFNRWTPVVEERFKFEYRVAIPVMVVVFAILFLLVYKNILAQRYNKELLKISTTDRLTGLLNRLKIDELLMREYKKAESNRDYRGSIMIVDIDYFKNINDTYGHQIGDEVLVNISKLMKSTLRSSDYVARWGGEEFLVILNRTDLNHAKRIAQTLRERIEGFVVVPSENIKVTASIGVSEIRADRSIKEIIASADEALYEAKNEGRNRVKVAYI